MAEISVQSAQRQWRCREMLNTNGLGLLRTEVQADWEGVWGVQVQPQVLVTISTIVTLEEQQWVSTAFTETSANGFMSS